ncbi:bifunctional diguanylate cyclase/phosphodiesterase [Paraglaciecola sp. L3A3]|uniref:putative bifunctional diguanylate cyclase/phosphodiesterase n=1 Tax=Paraglaciecola sp. L3A3 TaxID=2686358 RepID=UPI00131C5B44|nr:bifunctional diguanylate cyclase/phosphodiesterase [Paraglaciecola sp. L3A3]
MNTINRTLQVISIQHELSMNIGLGLQLDKMLDHFMQRAQRRLSLYSINVIYDLDKSANHSSAYLSFPNKKNVQKNWLLTKAQTLFEQHPTNFTEIKTDSYYYYFFIIPEFGVLVLERKHQAIDLMILHALQPLLTKLSISCQACIEHQNLKTEIEARKQAEQQLIQQSLLDPLTGLANRKMFIIKLTETITNTLNNGKFGAVFFIDLDRFKVINDSLGHNIGDQVLKFVGQRFLKFADDNNTIARMGGDEFVLLANNLSNDKDIAKAKATAIAEKLSTQIAKPIYIGENTLSVSISTGISLIPLENPQVQSIEQQVNLIIRNADIAMYSIKHANRNGFNFFNKNLQSLSEQHTQVEKHLKLAIERHELEVNYQPLVDKTGQIFGAEALLRWNNKILGQVSPVQFIPVAEESGLIIEIGKWVLVEACKLHNQLHAENPDTKFKYISVNVSPRQFNQASFVQDVINILEKFNIQGQHIRIEITEGVAMDNIELAIHKIRALREFGIECMLDDFGSGYSSLSYLNKLPLKTIKIDRSFVSNIDSSEYHQVIIHAVQEICRYSQLECIAEGVETQTEFDYLATQGFNAYQGYYFHKPMPVKAFLHSLLL